METTYNVVLEVFFHFDAIGVNRDEKLKIFLIIIPLRIIEVITLFVYRKIKGNK